MPITPSPLLVPVLRVALALYLAGAGAVAAQAPGAPSVAEPYARATPGPVGAAYLTLTGGAHDDVLTGATTPVAGRVELHEIVTEGGVAQMREISGGISVPAGARVELKPGGLHIMLMDMPGPLAEGGSFPLTLSFAGAGDVTVTVPVRGVGAGADPQDGHGAGHGAGHGGHTPH